MPGAGLTTPLEDESAVVTQQQAWGPCRVAENGFLPPVFIPRQDDAPNFRPESDSERRLPAQRLSGSAR